MAASGPSGKRIKNKQGIAKPNLMPIMNLFLVIIPMLITMITATGLQMMALNLPGGGNVPNPDPVEEKANIYLGILPDKFQIRVDEMVVRNIPIRIKNGKREFDFITLNDVIDKLHEDHPTVDKIKVTPSNLITYEIFVKTMDVCKMQNRFPNIGFGYTKKLLLNN